MFPNMSGQIGVRGLPPADVDVEQDITPSGLVSSGTPGIRQFAWELAGLKRITPR